LEQYQTAYTLKWTWKKNYLYLTSTTKGVQAK
jgi:hypothetical protein